MSRRRLAGRCRRWHRMTGSLAAASLSFSQPLALSLFLCLRVCVCDCLCSDICVSACRDLCVCLRVCGGGGKMMPCWMRLGVSFEGLSLGWKVCMVLNSERNYIDLISLSPPWGRGPVSN